MSKKLNLQVLTLHSTRVLKTPYNYYCSEQTSGVKHFLHCHQIVVQFHMGTNSDSLKMTRSHHLLTSQML